MTTYYVGIDPDKGYAIWCGEAKSFMCIETTCFWRIITSLDNLLRIRNVPKIDFRFSVYIEAPHQNKPVWKFSENKKIQNCMSSKIGENKAKAKLIIEYCKMKDILVTECKPTKKSMTKLDDMTFKKLTGYMGETSEHGRDAGMLVYGRQ
jgi:hypothetical protein